MCDSVSVPDPRWKRVTKPEFDYYGSCLGKFTVKNAIVWECSECGGIMLLAPICKGWEVEKAIDIIENSPFLASNETRFLREVCRKTKQELAVALDVSVEDVERWEIGFGASPGDGRLLARYFLRQEGRYNWISGPCGRKERILKKVRWETED